MTITNGDGGVSSGTILVKTVAPGLFGANQDGQGVAAGLVLRVRGSQSYEEIAQFDAVQNQLVPRPIDLGPESDQVFLILFGTGIRFRSSLSAVTVTIGGANTGVSFAGAQPDFVGLDQVNVPLSRHFGGRGELDVSILVDSQVANFCESASVEPDVAIHPFILCGQFAGVTVSKEASATLKI